VGEAGVVDDDDGVVVSADGVDGVAGVVLDGVVVPGGDDGVVVEGLLEAGVVVVPLGEEEVVSVGVTVGTPDDTGFVVDPVEGVFVVVVPAPALAGLD